jgi:hypothetical protein
MEDELDNNIRPLRDLADDAPERLKARGLIKKKIMHCRLPNFEGTV